MTDHGIHATGLWEVINNTHEIVMVWATTVDDAVNVEEDCYLLCGVVIHYCSYWSATFCVVIWYVLWFSHREERGYGSRQKGKPASTNKERR